METFFLTQSPSKSTAVPDPQDLGCAWEPVPWEWPLYCAEPQGTTQFHKGRPVASLTPKLGVWAKAVPFSLLVACPADPDSCMGLVLPLQGTMLTVSVCSSITALSKQDNLLVTWHTEPDHAEASLEKQRRSQRLDWL